jgi:hydroxyacylglutathione hydrolase
MIVKGLTVGLLQENCYIFGCSRTRRAVIIDPGDNARAILRVVDQQALKIDRIINTHAHFDHVMAVGAIKAATGAPFYLHELDLPVLHELPDRVRLWLDMEVDPLDDPDGYLSHGDQIAVGDETLEVRFTPGHAPGHVVLSTMPGARSLPAIRSSATASGASTCRARTGRRSCRAFARNC